jgi:hypothetical protein
MRLKFLAVLPCLLFLPSLALPEEPAVRFFETKIRPVLAEHCWSCHGPNKQRGGLRFDSRQGMLAEGDHGPAVMPGEPDKSFLLHAVRQNGEIKMPPKGKLTPEAIHDLATWIKMGAPWPAVNVPVATESWRSHWAFQPVRNPAAPTPKDRSWRRNSIDDFILDGLESNGLQPADRAPPRTLVRRLSFDVIGLPPTPTEVDEYVRDAAVDPEAATTRLVDRLLASPHYGERWGRHWLDVARYADTKGYVFFEEPNFPWASTYRDYVIESLNRDLPYDRFVLEQLAADHLDLGQDRRPLRALGFLTLGGRFMSNQHDILDDRIDVVTRGLLGLTVTCARCHDHKYDPVSQRDYYALYGVFASCAEPTVPPLYEPPPTTDEYVKFDKELKAREQKLTEFVKAKHSELVTGARQRVAEYLLAAQAAQDAPNTEEFMLIADGRDLNPTMIARWQSYLKRRAQTHDPVFAPWYALATLPKPEFSQSAAQVLAQVKGPINARVAMALAAPVKDLADVAQRYAALLLEVDKKWQNVKEAARLDDPADEELRQVFYAPDAAANIALLPYGDLSLLPDRASQGKLQELRKALEQWRSTGAGAPPRAMVLEDLTTPVEPYVFLRGNPNNRGPVVPRQFLTVLAGPKPAPSQKGSGRLELARAIATRDNPLTARVIVNRIWAHYFGAGLVRTPSDFGLRGEAPSHPELLDHLANAFMAEGWSMKKLHRRLLLSATYRQSSQASQAALLRDPDNRFLARMPRRRLDFEATRDALLAVAGRLQPTLGGPSAKDLFASNRRTLYGFLDRLNVPGLYRTFDFPSPDATSPQREDTTIAPQALFLMNHPFVVRCAQGVMRRPAVTSLKDEAAKIEQIYGVLFGRAPTPEEHAFGQEYLTSGGTWDRFVHALLQCNEFVWLD